MKIPAGLVLEENERILWHGRMSWKANLLLVIAGIALIPVLVGFILLLLAYLSIISTEYFITTHRIYTKYGLIARNARDVRTEWIASATVVQGFFGRLLNYGDLIVVTPGENLGSVRMRGIHDPMIVKAVVEDAMKKGKKIAELKKTAEELSRERLLGRITQEEYERAMEEISRAIKNI
jgi:uncharacterized membrane protein YdbT with pleckstrin-like domain